MDISSNFTTIAQQYDDTEDLFIEIPQEVLEHLNWKEGDELNWQIKHKEIILTKIENTTTIQKQHNKTNNDWYTVKEEAINEYLNSESEGKEYRDQSDEQSQERTVPLPSNFPYFP